MLFRSEGDVQAWCHQRNQPRGEVLQLAEVWRLSQEWYGDRLSSGYRGRSLAELLQTFSRSGLRGPFWEA